MLFPLLAICVPLQGYVCEREMGEERILAAFLLEAHCQCKPCIHKLEFHFTEVYLLAGHVGPSLHGLGLSLLILNSLENGI